MSAGEHPWLGEAAIADTPDKSVLLAEYRASVRAQRDAAEEQLSELVAAVEWVESASISGTTGEYQLAERELEKQVGASRLLLGKRDTRNAREEVH